MDTPKAVHHTHNGVPRSSWFRAARRIATWHRPYARHSAGRSTSSPRPWRATPPCSTARRQSGFRDRPRSSSRWSRTSFLPLAWVIVLWGHGATTGATSASARTSSSGSFRASVTVTATVSFIAFATSCSPVPALGRRRPRRRPGLHRDRCGSLARRVLHRDPRSRPAPCTGCCWSARFTEALEVLHRGHPDAAGRHGAGRHPPDRGVRVTAAAARSPVPVLRRSRRPRPGARDRRRHGRGLRLGQRRAGRAAPARLAARGHRRRPGRRAAAHRHRRPPGAHPAGRGPAAAVRRGAQALRRGLAGQERHGPAVRGGRPAARCSPLFAGHRRSDLVLRPGSGLLPPAPGRPRGQDFSVWKFRTMYVDAEERLAHARRPERERRPAVQDARRPARSPRSAGSCARPRSTSCPS